MTALAEILAQKNIKIYGSDTAEVFFTDSLLKKIKAVVFQEFNPENLKKLSRKIDLVIHSTAYNSKNNSEVAFAKENKLQVLNYPQALGLLFNKSYGLAVCGTHGKTTTTALLAQILKTAGTDPSALVGSKVAGWDSGSLSGQGRYFVIEADEYQNKLRYYNPRAVIITNIDYDHPDFFKNPARYVEVFEQFVKKIPRQGFIVYNAADPRAKAVCQKAKCQKISFAARGNPDFKITKRRIIKDKGQEIIIRYKTGSPKQILFKKLKFTLPLFGIHNALNAAAAITAAMRLGVKKQFIKKALHEFKSTERRFQKMGQLNQGLLFDDYAHHPKEITATLKGARERFPEKQIIAAFHPHTFSRTQAFKKQFAQSLALADKVFVIDIYASARENPSDFKISAKTLVSLVNKAAPARSPKAQYIPTIQQLALIIKKISGPRVLFISMGAGDIWKIHALILKKC